MNTNAKSARKPAPWPSKTSIDQAALASILRDKEARVGRNRALLIKLVEAAIFPLELSPFDDSDFISDGERSVYDRQVGAVSAAMRMILKAAGSAAASGEFDLDPAYAAANQRVGHLGQAAIGTLVEAYRAIAMLAGQPLPAGKRGRSAIEDAPSRLVSAVVAYARWAGLPLEQNPKDHWDIARSNNAERGSRRTNEEVRPKSVVADLLTRLRDAFAVEADNTLLRGLLQRSLEMPASAGDTDEPTISDIVFADRDGW